MTWVDITRRFARTDPKNKARLDIMGLIAYLACDEEAKDKLRAEEAEKSIKLRGDETDPDRTALIDKSISTIAHETPSQKIQREANLLSEIHQCCRNNDETTESYANRLEAKVANYIHQRNARYATDDRQWVLLLL